MTRFIGRIDRRIMLQVRVDPAWLAPRLPDGFEPTVVDGRALGGLCLLRWQGLRPAVSARVPLGLTLDGVAERWFAQPIGQPHRRGVVVPQRAVGGAPRARLARSVAGGVVHAARIRDFRHHDELHVAVRGGTPFDLEVGVRPVAQHADTAAYGGDRRMLDALHACTVRGWAVEEDGTVTASELRVVDEFHALPVEVVHLEQSLLPTDAEVDHALFMADCSATLQALAGRHRAAVDVLEGRRA